MERLEDATPPPFAETDVAIVGMAGRFPGAPDVDVLWERVVRGDDCLTEVTPDDLTRAGLDAAALADPDYVARTGRVDHIEDFDPGFFGIGKRDAAIMDPQHRVLLECVWEALESAGHVPETFDGAISVFAGCGANTYLLNNLLPNRALTEQLGWFLLRHTGNDKDFLTTGISYRLDLRGPSVNVQTACSTSLVAVHLAVQSLLAFECDLAVAGGSTIEVPHAVGYRYHEGEILSGTGYCRAFDAASDGTVLTGGAGAVVLRRANEAWEHGDPVLAVIRGSAVNNDGARKVGFLAPSVDGHADVVREALAVAGVDAGTITLLEAHGTGTAVGDPIEVAALTSAFRASTDRTGYCRLVSTKPNIGHLDTAAGLASLVKVVQSLRHGVLPPLANHTGPNPLLDLAGSPFTLSGEATPWAVDGPRRAGISSLGVGGTNAHVVVEEAPPPSPAPPGLAEQALVLSARSPEALDAVSARLADHLERHPDLDLADVAHTLAAGRRHHTIRRVVVAQDARDAVGRLRVADRQRTHDAAVTGEAAVAFLFPGGGAQYPGMTAGLDARFAEFHQVMEDGIPLVRELSGVDLAGFLKPDADPDRMRHLEVSLPAVFLVEVALARQWMAWGVQPAALLGHSLGEYAAAHLAGVFTFDDALRVVTTRAGLMASVGGDGTAMLSIPLPVAEVAADLSDRLSLAVVNAENECVVSGAVADIVALRDRLEARGVTAAEIPIAVAAHSHLLDPILPEFRGFLEGVELRSPALPYVSNLTGTWVTPEQAVSPQYWVDHLRSTVRFADGLTTVLSAGPCVLTELGPGQALSRYARQHALRPAGVVPALRHPSDPVDDTVHTLGAFARLWAHGATCSPSVTTGPGRRRLRLPTYPFERQRCWVDAPGGVAPATTSGHGLSEPDSVPTAPAERLGVQRIPDLADWAWVRRWSDLRPAPRAAGVTGPWLVLADPNDPTAEVIARGLRALGEAVTVSSSLDEPSAEAARSICLVAPASGGRPEQRFDAAAARLLGDGARAVRRLAGLADPGRLVMVTHGALPADADAAHPEQAVALGPVLVAPKEYDGLVPVLVDVDDQVDATRLAAEVVGRAEPVVALRGDRTTAPAVERVRLEPAATASFVPGGTYVVTGGLGQVGVAVATHLASGYGAQVAVVVSEALPAPAERPGFLRTHGSGHPTSRRIRRLEALQAAGGRVEAFAGDLADPAEVRRVLDEVEAALGPIDGVVHAAGRLADGLIETADASAQEAVTGVKARAAVVLADEVRRRRIGRLVLVSSSSTVLAPAGQSAYVAANAVLDSLAGGAGSPVSTIAFGVWSGGGMAVEAARRADLGLRPGEPIDHPVLAEHAALPDGSHAFVASLDAGTDWLVNEHRVGGAAVLPGTGHVELMLAALRRCGAPAALRRLAFLTPLVVPEGAEVLVRVTVGAPGPDGTRNVRLESDRGGGRAWEVHSEAEQADAGPVPQWSDGADRHPLDPLGTQRRHLDLGRRWDGMGQATASADDVRALVSLADDLRDEVGGWLAHPALADLGVGCAAGLGGTVDGLLVPVGCDGVTWHAPLGPTTVARARRRPGAPAGFLTTDVRFESPGGDLLVALHGLTLREVPTGVALASAHPAGPGGGHGPVLLEVARELGIRPEEGVEIVERVLASGLPQLVVSSLPIDDLARLEGIQAEPEAPPRAAADGDLGGAVRALFGELLGVADVGPDDDFFELGGHSLVAIRLLGRVQKLTGVRLPLAALFEVPTPRALTERLLEHRPELALAEATEIDVPAAPTAASAPEAARTGLPASLVPVRPTGTLRPLFVVHGAGGNVLNLWGMVRHLPADRPVWGLQAKGIDGTEPPDPDIVSMAERYAEAIRAVQPRGPYLLGGYSGGGVVALEMANILQRQGDEVSLVVLIDTIPRGVDRPRALQRYLNALGHARRDGRRAIVPYLKYSLGIRLGLDPVDVEGLGLGFGDTSEYGVVDLADHFESVINAHQFSTYPVDVVIAKAEKVYPAWPWHYGWKGRVLGRIDTFVVPGNHFEMFTAGNAPVLVDLLQPYLEEADRKASRQPLEPVRWSGDAGHPSAPSA